MALKRKRSTFRRRGTYRHRCTAAQWRAGVASPAWSGRVQRLSAKAIPDQKV